MIVSQTGSWHREIVYAGAWVGSDLLAEDEVGAGIAVPQVRPHRARVDRA